jgi:hypothetical protein
MIDLTPEVLQRLIERIRGGDIPVRLERRPPHIDDPSRTPVDHHWKPLDITTTKLVRCLEALRDISTRLESVFGTIPPEPEKRQTKTLIEPIYSLAFALRKLYNDVLGVCWEELTDSQQRRISDEYRTFTGAVPLDDNSVLKTVRDKITAHLDMVDHRPIWELFTFKDTIGWAVDCLKFFWVMLAPDIYSWTRFSSNPTELHVMNVDAREAIIKMNGNEADCITDFWTSPSPKHDVSEQVQKLFTLCYRTDLKLGLQLQGEWKLAGMFDLENSPQLEYSGEWVIEHDVLILRASRRR